VAAPGTRGNWFYLASNNNNKQQGFSVVHVHPVFHIPDFDMMELVSLGHQSIRTRQILLELLMSP
jgi:hypothetical protein